MIIELLTIKQKNMGFSTKKRPSGKTKMNAKMGTKCNHTNASKRKVSTDIRPQSK